MRYYFVLQVIDLVAKNDQVPNLGQKWLNPKVYVSFLNFFIKVDQIIIADNISSATNTNNKNQPKHKNMIAQELNFYLKTLNASNSKRLFCDSHFSSKGFYLVKFCVIGILYFIITKVKAEITFWVGAICLEINVRRKFTCFVTYRHINRVVIYLFSPKFLDRCQVDSNKKT